MCITDRGVKEARQDPIGVPTIGRREKDDIHLKVAEIAIALKKHIKDENADRKIFIEAIDNNTKLVKDLKEETAELLHAWSAMKNTLEVLDIVGKGIKWLSGFAIVGVILKWAMDHVG